MKLHYVTIIGHKILNKVQIRGLGLRIISGFQDLWNSLHLILWHYLCIYSFIYLFFLMSFLNWSILGCKYPRVVCFSVGNSIRAVPLPCLATFRLQVAGCVSMAPCCCLRYTVSPLLSCFQSAGGESHAESSYRSVRWYRQ